MSTEDAKKRHGKNRQGKRIQGKIDRGELKQLRERYTVISEEKLEIEEVGRLIVDAGLRVHRELGPGLIESAYQACFAYELRQRNLDVALEIPLPVRYGGLLIEEGYRIDMLIESLVVVENKSVHQILPIHVAQLLTYLRLSGNKLGFLINWNVPLFKDGVQRIANNL